MDTSNTGGDSGSGSSPLPRQKPDILAGLAQVKESLRAWKQLIDEGKEERLMLKKIEPPPGLENVHNRMLTESELKELRQRKKLAFDYMQRVRKTPRIDPPD